MKQKIQYPDLTVIKQMLDTKSKELYADKIISKTQYETYIR